VVEGPPPVAVWASAKSMFARTQSAAGPAGGRTTKTGGNTRIAGSNSGSRLCRYPHTTPVRLPSAPCRSTGISVHGGGVRKDSSGAVSASPVPPIQCWSP
jgi:hypothetical protein